MFLLGKVWELDLCILNFRIDMNINGNGFCFLVGSTCLLTNLVESMLNIFYRCPRCSSVVILDYFA